MADNFRIKIEDLEGNGSLHGSKEESQDSKVLPEKETAGEHHGFVVAHEETDIGAGHDPPEHGDAAVPVPVDHVA